MTLLETIKCKNGKLYNLNFHQVRFDTARQQCFGEIANIALRNEIQVPEKCQNGLFRCRVYYSGKITKIEFIAHEYKKIERLKLIRNNTVSYKFKYSNRDTLNQLFALRGKCDDILIVKNGNITDSCTANPVFWDGSKWWTPDTPLLPGTQRAHLLSEKKIHECRITTGDLDSFAKIGLINALQDMNDMPVISISKIER